MDGWVSAGGWIFTYMVIPWNRMGCADARHEDELGKWRSLERLNSAFHDNVVGKWNRWYDGWEVGASERLR